MDCLKTVSSNQKLVCKLKKLEGRVGVPFELKRCGDQILNYLLRKVKGWMCVGQLLGSSIRFQANTLQRFRVNFVAYIEETSAHLLLNFEVSQLSVNREQCQVEVRGVVNLVYLKWVHLHTEVDQV